MTDPKVHEIIADAVAGYYGDGSEDIVANAVVGALATSGFAIVRVDADVVRSVLAEMSKKAAIK